MDLSYAFHIDGRVSALPIALWCTDYTQGVLGTKETPSQPCRIGFAPVAGAYVACIEKQAVMTSLSAAAKAVRFGRTNDFGWVLLRDRADLGAPDEVPASGWKKKELPSGGLVGPDALGAASGVAGVDENDGPDDDGADDAMDAGVPRPRELTMFGPDDAVMFDLDLHEANSGLMYVVPNREYHLFWTYDAVLFDRFVGAADRDLAGAIKEYGVGRYAAQPFLPRAPVDRLGALSAEERGAVARLLSTADGEGYHGGWLVYEGRSAVIFDGTPRPLRTLYLCEWLQWMCEHAVHDDPHWPYLLALRSTIRASEDGMPIPDLAKRLPYGPRGQRARQLRAYLHALAWAGMDDRGYGATLVDVWGESKLHGHWRDVATAMQRQYGLRHPAQDAPDLSEFKFSDDERAALVAYFDMYALGFRRAADAEALDAHWALIERALQWVREQQKALLGACGALSLMRAVALHVREGVAKAALADRYHYACARLGIVFWREAGLALPNQAAWDAYKPFAAWLTEDPGLWVDAFLGLLKSYVRGYPELKPESLEELVRYLFRYHLALGGKAIEQELPTRAAVVRIEPDLRSGRVAAKLLRDNKQTVLAELELLTRLETIPAQEVVAPVGPTNTTERLRRYRRAMDRREVRTFTPVQQTLRVLAPESHELEGFPKALSEAADVASAGLAASALLVEMKRQKTWAVDTELYLNLVQDGLQAFEPGLTLVAPALERIGAGKSAATLNSFVKGAARLGRLGDGLEAVRNLSAGYSTLATFFSPESAETDLAYYLDRGEGLPALLETTKGVVQLVAGAAGLHATVLGAGTVVATVPLSTCVSVGLIAIVTLDVLIYVSTAGGSPVRGFEDNVRQARRAQFELDRDRILLPDDELPGTGNASKRPRLARSRLAKQLGTLHAVVHAARAGGPA